MIYYVDIDETICYYKDEREYQKAVPNFERIEKINDLYDKGNIIIYWTARGSTIGLDRDWETNSFININVINH